MQFAFRGAPRVTQPRRRTSRGSSPSQPGRLHAAAHSHHPWPDVTREAHLQAWDDAARHHDDKWDAVSAR